MVSIIHNESWLSYGENEGGFRLLSLTRMRGWGQLSCQGDRRVQQPCCSCCCWVDDRNYSSASGCHLPLDVTSPPVQPVALGGPALVLLCQTRDRWLQVTYSECSWERQWEPKTLSLKVASTLPALQEDTRMRRFE